MEFLKFSHGNAKLSKSTLIFSLPAGKTCPGARFCRSMAVYKDLSGTSNKRQIQDGPEVEFRCFAASQEVQYDNVFKLRAHNLGALVRAERLGGVEAMRELIIRSIAKNLKPGIQLIRIHESGDFYSAAYLQAWIKAAATFPGLRFYFYSKSLNLFVNRLLPDNMFLTASVGGRFDNLIDRFERYSLVVNTEDEATKLGLEVDHDDSHCLGDKPFALLVHGTQPKGSAAGRAIRERRKAGKFAGYNGSRAKVTT